MSAHVNGEALHAPPRGYSWAMQTVHWLTPLLLITLYVRAWSIDGAGSREEAAWRVMMHRSFGLCLLLLTLLRLRLRQNTVLPKLPADLPRLQSLAARGMTIMLYGMLVLQPLLGLIASQLHGDRVRIFGILTLPLLLPTNRGAVAGDFHNPRFCGTRSARLHCMPQPRSIIISSGAMTCCATCCRPGPI